MRELINQYSKILNETDYTSLRRRLSPELFEEIMTINNTGSKLTESSLNRISKHIENNQCAVITAFRDNLSNCLTYPNDVSKLNTYTNKSRNKKLMAALLTLGYDITKIKGSYIENYMTDNEVEVKEDSLFVVNSNNDSNFINNIIRLGEIFCQDSVLIFDLGNNYVYGTNNSEFPGLGNKLNVGKFKPGLESKFMTKVSGRPFTMENYKTQQMNTKKIIEELAKPIIDLLK